MDLFVMAELRHLIREIRRMTLDLSKLVDTETKLVAAVEVLIKVATDALAALAAAGGDTAAMQAKVDEVAAALSAEVDKVDAVPGVVPPPAA